MSLYIQTTEEQISDCEMMIAHFIRAKNRYYSKLKTRSKGRNSDGQIRASMNYFDDRLIHYRAKKKELKKWLK